MSTTPQQRLARAALRLGQHFGVGGASWKQARSAGDGISAAKTVSSVATITGYVLEELPSALATALAGATVAKATWWYVTQASVAIGDSVQSVATSTLVYTLETADSYGGISLCRLSIGGITA